LQTTDLYTSNKIPFLPPLAGKIFQAQILFADLSNPQCFFHITRMPISFHGRA